MGCVFPPLPSCRAGNWADLAVFSAAGVELWEEPSPRYRSFQHEHLPPTPLQWGSQEGFSGGAPQEDWGHLSLPLPEEETQIWNSGEWASPSPSIFPRGTSPQLRTGWDPLQRFRAVEAGTKAPQLRDGRFLCLLHALAVLSPRKVLRTGARRVPQKPAPGERGLPSRRTSGV